METISIAINDTRINVKKGTTILEAAQTSGGERAGLQRGSSLLLFDEQSLPFIIKDHSCQSRPVHAKAEYCLYRLFQSEA